jgi:phenylalanyl-tRNA synthetase beta subunit
MVFEIGNIFIPELPGSVEKQQRWKLVLGVAKKGDSTLSALASGMQQRLNTNVQHETFTPFPVVVRGRLIDVFEYDIEGLMLGSKINFGSWDSNKHSAGHVKYREQSKFPAVRRDISAWMPTSFAQTQAEKFQDQIYSNFKKIAGALLESVESSLIEIKGRHSMTLHLVFQSFDRTLTKEEVDAIMDRLVQSLIELGATIR